MAQVSSRTVVNIKQRLIALGLLLVPGLLWGWAFWQEKIERPLITLYAVDRAPVLSLSFDRTGTTLLTSSVGPGRRQGARGGAQLFFDLNRPDKDLRTVPISAFGRMPYRRQRALRVYKGNPDAHGPAYFSPDADRFATVTGDMLTVWNTESGKSLRTIKGARPVVAWTPDGGAVCWQSDTGDILLQEVETGKLRAVYPSPFPGPLHKLLVSPDNRRLVGVGTEGKVVALSTVTGLVVKGKLPEHATALTFAPNMTARLVVATDLEILTYDLDREPMLPATDFPPVKDAVALSFRPDGQTLAVATRDGTVQLIDSDTQDKRIFLHLREGVSTLAFSPDGKTLATGLKDGRILLWLVP